MKKLQEIRREKGLTQEHMAKAASITVRQYRRIENDEATPNVKHAILLAKALNKTVEELFNYLILP